MKNICNTRKNGLSPLARGARHSQADPATALRFIPAGAGNTPASSVYSARSPVYPRWRGEPPLLFFHRPYSCGLSPLARGTRPRNICRSAIPRFIPAGAGNTDCRHQVISPKPVYPRWRGEHTVISLPLGDRNGLSPLARGTRNSLRIRQQKYRFIPAGAGNTALLCRSRSVPTVYPRWRGEHVTWRRPAIDFSGLSPLARGTLEPVFLSARNFRFIPAGAGNTPHYR